MINLAEYLADFLNELTIENWIKAILHFVFGLFLLFKGIPWIRDIKDKLLGR